MRNLKLLWFMTKPDFSIQAPSVPHNSSRLCFILRSSPAKPRTPMEAFTLILSVSFGITWRGWIMLWFVWGTILSKISSVNVVHASKSVVAFLAWLITLGNFVNILPPVSNVCRTFYLPPLQLVLSNETTVNSVHFYAVIVIRRSIFSTSCHLLLVPQFSSASVPLSML